jgi:hypothetical protein
MPQSAGQAMGLAFVALNSNCGRSSPMAIHGIFSATKMCRSGFSDAGSSSTPTKSANSRAFS